MLKLCELRVDDIWVFMPIINTNPHLILELARINSSTHGSDAYLSESA